MMDDWSLHFPPKDPTGIAWAGSLLGFSCFNVYPWASWRAAWAVQVLSSFFLLKSQAPSKSAAAEEQLVSVQTQRNIRVVVFTNSLAMTSASTLSKRTTGAPEQLYKANSHLENILTFFKTYAPSDFAPFACARHDGSCGRLLPWVCHASDLHIPLSSRARTLAPHGQGWVL